jgi:hypothetical protein
MAEIPTEARMRRRARRMKIINVPMRRLLSLPFPTPLSRQLMLLTITGRKTGRRYRQPVSYLRDADTLLTPGGGRWTLNLRNGQPIPIRLNGRHRQARPELVSNPDEIVPLLQKMMIANPRITTFVPFIGSDGSIDRSQLATAAAHGFCIVRWRLDEPA